MFSAFLGSREGRSKLSSGECICHGWGAQVGKAGAAEVMTSFPHEPGPGNQGTTTVKSAQLSSTDQAETPNAQSVAEGYWPWHSRLEAVEHMVPKACLQMLALPLPSCDLPQAASSRTPSLVPSAEGE